MNCQGKVNTKSNTRPCLNIVYRCTKCGQAGCCVDSCSNLKFSSGSRCTSCGAQGTRKQI